MDWKGAKIFDYTGATEAGKAAAVKAYGEDVMKVLRDPPANRTLIVLDTAYGLKGNAPAVVRDHINLSGHNPLIGPNHPAGDRFPVVNDIYVKDAPGLKAMDTVVAAGIKTGRAVDASELELIQKLGADCYCFNLVPTMLVAAHAGWRVLAIVGPEGNSWQQRCLDQITQN